MTSGPAPDNPAVRLHYTYDAWNRLTKVRADNSGSPGNLIAAYEYDAQNRRIVKGVDDDSDGSLDTFTHFLHGNDQVLETRTGDDLSGQGPTADSLTPTYQNLWSKRYIDALILRDEYSGGVLQAANRLYYLSDANHNVTALITPSATVIERYIYTPYGDVTIYDDTWTNTRNSSSYDNTTLYTGRELDVETALMYYRARYYDPALGRFISRDPIGYAGSKWNLYEYTSGNPLNRIDPSGRWWQAIRWCIYGAGAGAAYCYGCGKIEKDFKNENGLRSPKGAEVDCMKLVYKYSPVGYDCKPSVCTKIGNKDGYSFKHAICDDMACVHVRKATQCKPGNCLAFIDLLLTSVHECAHIRPLPGLGSERSSVQVEILVLRRMLREIPNTGVIPKTLCDRLAAEPNSPCASGELCERFVTQLLRQKNKDVKEL